jgi:DNA-binding CsgD family transcriptional regulator
VVKLLADGLIYKEIAQVLNISTNTVKYHIREIYRRTDCRRTADLIKYAIRVGITDINGSVKIKIASQRLRNYNS